MSQAPALSPELVRQSVSLARALSAAVRNWALYPPEHPAVDTSVRRLSGVLADSVAGAAFTFGVTPHTLLVAGLPLPEEQPVTETARLLHDRDVLQITFWGEVPPPTLHALLGVLSRPADELRASGGPAKAWNHGAHPAIAIVPINYEKILEDRGTGAAADRHDDVWRSLVNSIVEGRAAFDERQQQRLIDIAGDVDQIEDLAAAVTDPKRTAADGSPLITTQGATVLAAYRHLTGIAQVVEPERVPEVMRNVAAATARLDPNVVLEMMQSEEGTHEAGIVGRLAASFNDDEVARIVGTSLARDGKATARLAQVFDTIAPDVERKQRVLTMAHSFLSEHDFGVDRQFQAAWDLMEAQLLNYDERPFISEEYQIELANVGQQGDKLAIYDLPGELPEWLGTLGQDNVRRLSVLLITDLLRIEENPERAADIARDLAALGEDLLMAGAFEDALLVVKTLRQTTDVPGAVAPAACRAAVVSLGTSAAMRESASLLGDFDEKTLTTFSECCAFIGPTAIEGLQVALESEHEDASFVRARDIALAYGAAAIPQFAKMADRPQEFVQCTAAALLGATRSAEAVPPLQALLRRNDERVLRAAVSALAGIDDPSAARAIQTVLRAATGANRAAVVDALVAARDPRVLPVLTQILDDTDPFGDDHQSVLDALEAVRVLADERAISSVVTVMKKRRLFRWKKARAFKTASVQALRAIATSHAQQALDDARQSGDRLLKRIIARRP